MLYFVSVIGIDADYPLDDYGNFIVEAENEENLAAAIVADRLNDNDIDVKTLINLFGACVSWAKSSTIPLILSTLAMVSVFSWSKGGAQSLPTL